LEEHGPTPTKTIRTYIDEEGRSWVEIDNWEDAEIMEYTSGIPLVYPNKVYK
jgi:hypothetical protein